MAQGEYVFFCDSDDFIKENRLGCIYQIAETNKLDMLMFEMLDVKNGVIPNKDFYELDSLKTWESGKAFMSTPRHRINYTPWKYITRRELLMEHHLRFPTDMIIFEDGAFFLNMIQVAGKVGEVKILLYYYVTNPESIIHSLGKKKKHKLYVENILEYSAIIKKSYDALQNDPEILDWAKSYMINLMGDNAFFAMHNTARYGSLASNRDVIKRLRAMGTYPILHYTTNKYERIKN
jgi:Glycosyl transferase family 2.